jgi:hypothetical protein
MKKLKKTLGHISPQPLGKDVPALYSTAKDQALSLEKETIVVLLFMLVGLSENVLSGDKWKLSTWSAMKKCEEVGISNEKFNELYGNAANILDKIRKSNPMSSMF